MTNSAHIMVEVGPDKGLAITVPPQGARLGRSSKNDIVLTDPALSRHHCRLFFKTDDGLWITDLGSSNATVVNGSPLQEGPLRVGDTISLGDSTLRVVNDERAAGRAVPLAAVAAAAPAGVTPAAPVDLGLKSAAETAPARLTRGPLLVVAALMVLLAAVVWVPKLLKRPAAKPVAALPRSGPADGAFEIEYEKVQADTNNIFRYSLRLDASGGLTVQIDDVVNDRHVRKETNQVDAAYLQTLARSIEDAGFFTLDPAYDGLQPNVHERFDIAVTIGRRTHRSRVLNRVEPEVFRSIRDTIEQCGKNELGLWAIPFSTTKLVEMANDAYLQGRKLFDEREVKYGNLASAVRSFTEAEWYLETVDPKPEFYRDVVSGMTSARELQEQRYNDQSFKAERAIRLRQWNDAANELRVLLEMIPDRADPRNGEARKKLLDVESRLKPGR